MGRSFRPGGETFAEVACLQTFYCSGVAHVSCDGPNIVFTVYQNRNCPEGRVEKVIVANFVIPRDAWLAAKDMTLFELARCERGLPPPTELMLS